jgi:2-iminobutanoate/2-iminopropanoate deaminase
VYCSGMIGLDPQTNAMVEGGVGEQTKRALLNMSAVLHASNSSMSAVVKTTIMLVNMSDFAVVNEVYAKHFAHSPCFPARSTMAVAALPRDALVEIDCIALAQVT